MPSDTGSFEAEAALDLSPGLLALFPPWLEHYVAHTPGGAEAPGGGGSRVSISFNLPGSWQVLAGATVAQPRDRGLYRIAAPQLVPSITKPTTDQERARKSRRSRTVFDRQGNL